MNTQSLFEWYDRHGRTIRLVMVPILVFLVADVYALVYVTGGIKYVYSHVMYVPILLSGIVLGTKGGVLFGLLGGLVLGPYMPIDVNTGELQQTVNWLYRTGFFTLIGSLSGAASDSVRSYLGHLKWLARHDASTGLPNRSALLDRLSELSRKKSSSASFSLVVVSVENDLELKAAFGFGSVEEAIRQLAERFSENLVGNQIYHTDTAQIAIVVDEGVQDTDKLLHELAEASREPVLYNGVPLHTDTRMGYVTFGQVAEAPEVYLQRAEAALTVAQEKDRIIAVYSPEILTATEENLSILGELRDAVKEGQLSLHYQPKIVIATGEVHGAEGLMRWSHPKRGNIPPGVFIPRAEQSTLIELITEFALDQAIGQMTRWRRDGIYVPIAVNIAPQMLLQPDFTDLILRLLDRHGLIGEQLELEITERGLMRDMDRTIAELVRLVGAQIIISIDDFGTGYSSLQYLHRLPVSLIKIDQSFVCRLPDDRGAADIVDAAVTLAHKMGLKALAEGVETGEVYDFLKNTGCDLAQGLLISAPLPADDFVKWLAGHNDKRTAV